MKRIIPAAMLAIFLSGCGITPQGDAVLEFLKIRGQKAADQTAQNALDYLCTYARVGSIARLFPNLADRHAWRILCDQLPPMAPLPPPEKIEI